MEKYATLQPLSGRKRGDLGSMFQCLAERLQASGEKGCVRFRIVDKEEHTQWDLVLDEQGCRTRQHSEDMPDLEIITRMNTWKKIADGELSPLIAFARRRLRVRGDEKLGKRLLKQLASPDEKTDIC
jgi:putative sterol carrier protein